MCPRNPESWICAASLLMGGSEPIAMVVRGAVWEYSGCVRLNLIHGVRGTPLRMLSQAQQADTHLVPVERRECIIQKQDATKLRQRRMALLRRLQDAKLSSYGLSGLTKHYTRMSLPPRVLNLNTQLSFLDPLSPFAMQKNPFPFRAYPIPAPATSLVSTRGPPTGTRQTSLETPSCRSPLTEAQQARA